MQLIFEPAFLPSCCVLEKRMLIFNISFVHTHVILEGIHRKADLLPCPSPPPMFCQPSVSPSLILLLLLLYSLWPQVILSFFTFIGWLIQIYLIVSNLISTEKKIDSKHKLEITGVRVTLRWNFFQAKISFRIKDTSVKIWQLKKRNIGNSLAVQWLGLGDFKTGGPGLSPWLRN